MALSQFAVHLLRIQLIDHGSAHLRAVVSFKTSKPTPLQLISDRSELTAVLYVASGIIAELTKATSAKVIDPSAARP